jgi:F-box-like
MILVSDYALSFEKKEEKWKIRFDH